VANLTIDHRDARQYPVADERVTLADLVLKAAYRLGDTANQIWARDELEGYAQAGYEQFVAATEALFDMRHLDDRHEPVYTTGPADTADSRREWQPYRQPAATERLVPAHYTETIVCVSDPPIPYLGARTLADVDGLVGTVTSEASVPFARDTAPPADTLVPDEVTEIVRATWDGRRIEALTPQELDRTDATWETTTGYTNAYAVVNRGGRLLFKRVRGAPGPCDSRPYSDIVGVLAGGLSEPETQTVTQPELIALTPFAIVALPSSIPRGRISTFFPYPVSPAVQVTVYVEGWGALDETADYEVLGDEYGIPAVIDGFWMTGDPFGLPYALSTDTKNTRIDYVKDAGDLKSAPFEIQAWDTRYVLFYMLWKALDRSGKGQNKKLAAHYSQRYQLGVALVRARHDNIREAIAHVMGEGMPGERDAPPFARLPDTYDRRYR